MPRKKNKQHGAVQPTVAPPQQVPALETYDTSSAPLAQQPPHVEALLPDAPIAPGLPLPQRAGFGKAGREVQLYANHFKLNSVQAEALLYAVDIRPPPPRGVTLEVAAGPQKLLPKQLSRAVMQVATRGLGAACAYDGQLSLYATTHLEGDSSPEGIVIQVPRRAIEQGARFPDEIFSVRVKFIKLVPFNGANMSMESLQAFDTVLRHERAMQRDWAIVGRSHLTSAGAVPLGAGLEIWKGYKQSARPCQGGLHLVVDRAACAFVKAQPVINLVADVANLRGAAELARVQLVFGSRQWKAVSKVIKGVRVMKLHFPGQKRKATIKGLSKRSASEETFLDSELGRQVSVAQYFARKYKPLQYPHLPCLQVVGKSELLPLEVCDIVKGQRKTLLTDGDLSAKMIKVTASHPNDRWQQIEGTVSDVISRDATVRQFNIDVDRHMVSLTGRVLPPPALLYAGNKQVTPTDGSWDRSMSKLQLLEAPPKPLDRWAIVNFETGITAAQCGIVGNELRLMMKRHNFRRVPEAAVEIAAPRESVAATLNRAVSKRYQLAVVILPQIGGDDLRKEVKFHVEYAGANIGASMLTSCMRAMHIFKGTGGGPQGGRGGGGRGGRGGGGGRGGRFAGRGGGASAGNNSILKPTYLSNFVLKINSKLGGVNAKIAPPAQRLTSPGLLLMEVPTMVFGADVTHPSPGSDSQSVAAVVGSTDATCTRYEAQLSAQSGRQEIIEQLNEMTQKLLLAFYRKTTKKPERIVFFRDGVSEGQFQHCLAQELPQIKEACRAVSNDDGYNPQVTFVIVQKRHMTRLFAADAKDTDASGNVRAGTVVDRTITHPSEYDFFLQSHAGIQGTTKPSHYHVIWDEIGISPDTLQQFSYSLCHLIDCTL